MGLALSRVRMPGSRPARTLKGTDAGDVTEKSGTGPRCPLNAVSPTCAKYMSTGRSRAHSSTQEPPPTPQLKYPEPLPC